MGISTDMKHAVRILLSAIVAAFVAGGAASAPRIQFDHETQDWGTVYQGTKLEHAFKATNTGDAPLLIKQVLSSCGCTLASGWQRAISPGLETTFTASLDTASRLGRTETSLTVRSTDPGRKEVKLFLRANVVKAVDFEPALWVMFPDRPIGKPVAQELMMRPATEKNVKIESVRFNAEKLDVSYARIADADGRDAYHFTVAARKDAPAGALQEHIFTRVAVEGAGILEFDMNVRGNIVGGVTVKPATASMGMVTPGSDAVKEVSLSRIDGKALKVRKMKSDRATVVAVLAGPRSGSEVRVSVKASVQALSRVAERISGVVKVFVDVKGEPVVEIPYVYTVPEQGPGRGCSRGG